MPDGEDTVQKQEPVSEPEQASQEEGQTQEAATPEQQPSLTEEQKKAVAEILADEIRKAVAEAKDAGRRELQSQQDRNRAELSRAERRAKLAEQALKATDESLASLDPEIAKEIELARLRAEKRGTATYEQEDAARSQSEAYVKALRGSLESHLEALGIKKDDPRVDWAADAKDYLEGRNRFDESVAKIVKETQQEVATGFEKRLKEIESRLSATETEANSVETTASRGAVESPDAEFMKKFGAGELPANKTNIERYNKILAKYD